MLTLVIDRDYNDFSLHNSDKLCPTVLKLRDLPDTQNLELKVDSFRENFVHLLTHPRLDFTPGKNSFARMIIYIDTLDESYNACIADTIVCYIKLTYMGYSRNIPSLHC